VRTVLIVDDSQSIRTQLRALLHQCDYTVVAEAENGLKAIDRYLRYKPDLVTLDVYMPQLTGLEAAHEIFKFDPQAKVIVITSNLSQKTRLEAEELGVKTFIVKPLTLEKLQTALEHLNPEKKAKNYG